MDRQNKTIFVTGATGTQGGAVTNNLLKKGWKVVALTRNPDGNAAKNLKNRKVKIVEGNIAEPGSYKEHLDTCYGVFSVQNFWEHGFEEEIKQGKILADTAMEAGVRHFIYSSVGSAHRDTHLAHFESKWEIEEHIRKINLPYTIFRPVFFMENFLFMRDQIAEGKLINGVEPDVPLQIIAVDNVGSFVEQAFDEPDVFLGKEIDIASDQKTFPEMAEILSKEIGKTVSYIKLEANDVIQKLGDEWARMIEWFNNVGYNADINYLRETYDVDLISFRDWVKNSEFAKIKQKT